MPTLNVALEAARQSTAIVIPDGPSLTYGQLSDSVEDARKTLADVGLLQVQDAVSMSLKNSVEFAVLFLALGLQRCVAAPLNPAYLASEAEFYLSDSRSKLLLVHKGAVAEGNEAVKAAQKLNIRVAECHLDPSSGRLDINFASSSSAASKSPAGDIRIGGQAIEDDVALLLHTSGTTGRPKAVPLTHRNLTRTMENICRSYQLSSRDRTMLVMPLFHVHGLLCGLLAVLKSGGSAVIPPKFAASTFWKHFVGYKCNWYTAVPTIHQILLASPKPSPIPEIRFIRSCSSALSPATFHQIEAAFNAPVLEAYAMTEAAHQLCANPLPPGKRKPGAVGPGQGVEIRILDEQGSDVAEGEVCAKGANITSGYLNNPKANAESFTKDGFFRTGDRGRLDQDGYVVLTGRIKDNLIRPAQLINIGGEKISPLELDGALLAVEGVAEGVAFAVEDEKYGEVPWAAVVLHQGARLSEQDIVKGVAKHLTKFKLPRRVFIADTIPKTATGKIQRRNLAPVFKKLAEKEGPRAKL